MYRTDSSGMHFVTCEDFAAEYTKVPVSVDGLPVMVTPSIFGWITVMQRSYLDDGFNQDWSTYKYGFGSLDSYLWLGLERIYQLTNASNKPYRLRVELQQYGTGKWYSAEYWTFSVAGEADYYRLNVDK